MLLKKKVFEEGSIKIIVDYEKCQGHGECVTACPVDVFAVEGGKAVARHLQDCIECCACVNACPNGAIEHSSC